MPKILVLYHSRTGNTRLMAEAIDEGVEMFQGVEVELKIMWRLKSWLTLTL
jgi:flavodoxin